MEGRIDTLYYKCLIVLVNNPRYINGEKIDEQSRENLIATIRDPLHLKNIERVNIRLLVAAEWRTIMGLIAKRWFGDHVACKIIESQLESPDFRFFNTKVPGVKYMPGSGDLFKVELNGSRRVVKVKLREHDFAGEYKMETPRYIIRKYSRHDLSLFGITDNMRLNHSIVYDEHAFIESGIDEILEDAVKLGVISPRINIPKKYTAKYY